MVSLYLCRTLQLKPFKKNRAETFATFIFQSPMDNWSTGLACDKLPVGGPSSEKDSADHLTSIPEYAAAQHEGSSASTEIDHHVT